MQPQDESYLHRSASPWARTMASIHAQQNKNQVTSDSMVQSDESESQYNEVAAMTTQMPLPQETAIPPPRRKRNNSLIPPELMNDNTEGGRERAALATVFGVREYTESKVFWERQIAYYHDNGPGASTEETEGYVSITGKSVLSSPLLRRSPSAKPPERIDHSIASLVDSALENVGSDRIKLPATSSTSPPSSTAITSTNAANALPISNQFLLPDIPVVSKFTDLFEETDNFKNPSKVQSCSIASTLPGEQHYHEYASSVASERWANEIAPPLVFIGYPPAIFDLLKSDQDERIIVWGPDPQFLSASMATTTVAGKQQDKSSLSAVSISGATITPQDDNHGSKPNIRGFSSNTTAAAAAKTSDPREAVKSRRSRWSSHIIPDGLKIGKATLKIRKDTVYDNEQEARSSTLFRFSKRHGKKDKSSLTDDQSSINSVNSAQIPQVIEAATVEKLVEKLTISLDYTFMTDFFLTYRTFISPTQLCKLLILRFRWGLESDEEERRIVRIRTFVVLRHWLLNYFVHDFLPCRDLRIILTSFLNSLPFHPLVKRSPRDQRIVKSLKRVVRRLKKVYYKNSSTSERVKVIAPPPPTEEQERVEEMVRAKLAQGPIRRKTDIVSSVNVSDRHHGNMAVQDARLAPVVVVGSVRNAKSPVDVRASPTTQARRHLSSASISRSKRRKQIEEKMAVKSSYLQRMEQQKRAMERDVAAAAAAADTEDNSSSKCSVVSDDSLESALSPGTTDVESNSSLTDSEEDDDEEDEREDRSQQPSSKEREELERERQRREEEEERKRAEFFSPGHPSEQQQQQPLHPTSVAPEKASDGQLVSRIAQQLRVQDLSSNGDGATSTQTESAPNVGQHRQQGPLYLGHLASPSTTSGSNMHIQEVEASTSTDETTQQRVRSSIASTNSMSPRSHVVELDLPRPQPTAASPDARASVTSLYPRPFILYFRSEHMARQFCLIEANVLLNIDWEEMVHCRWTKMSTEQQQFDGGVHEEDNDIDSVSSDDHVNYTRRTRQLQLARRDRQGGIEGVIKRFNAVCQWVTSEIVRTRALDERVRVVEKFIRLAQKCKLYCNFATLVQILLGLQSPAVSRLKRTWDRVGSSEMRTLEQLSAFTSPMKNWKHIRDSMTQVAEEYGMSPIEVQIEMPGTNQHAFKKTKIKIPFGGCIPFLGIYLSDLVFNSEQPPYVHPNLENHKIYHAHTRMSSDISPLLTQPLVNFRKHRITATVIKRVLTFQNLARRYSFEHDAELYFLCSELESLDPDTIRRLSNEIEPDV